MLYCDQIRNYEDFKSRFGYKTSESGEILVNKNGVRQRMNSVPYLYWKCHFMYFHSKGHSLSEAFSAAEKLNTNKDVFAAMLRDTFGSLLSDGCPVRSIGHYDIQGGGICFDGDVNSIRYKNLDTGHVYKMKIGKYVNKYLELLEQENPRTFKRLFWLQNPALKIFFMEEITELWKNKRLKDKSLHLVVDKDFKGIYSTDRRVTDASSFDSCMDNDENWHYYAERKGIYSAVSLQDDDKCIYARCILVKCKDQDGKEHNLLERIYCNKRMYKDYLFELAKNEGIFDLYKGLEASCHDSYAIFSTTKNHFPKPLYIEIELEDGDWMSYQDTFKWYYHDLGKAYNGEYSFNEDYSVYHLDTTSEHLEWDD